MTSTQQLMEKYLNLSNLAKERLQTKDLPIFEATLMVEVTNRCNSKICKTCFRYTEEHRNIESALLDLLFQYANNHFFGVVPTGGEPTLVLDLILERAARYEDMPIIISTNGIDVSEHMVRKMASSDNLIVGTSIDGVGEIHDFLRGNGTFERVSHFLEILKNYGIPFGVQTVANHYNLSEILDGTIADFLERQGVVTWVINRYYPIGQDEKTQMDLMLTSYGFLKLMEYRQRLKTKNPYSFKFGSAEGREREKCTKELTVSLDGHIFYCPFIPWAFGKIMPNDNEGEISKKIQVRDYEWQKLIRETNHFCPLYGNTIGIMEFGETFGRKVYPARGILDVNSQIHQKYLLETGQVVSNLK